jgi:hypothetical protein
MFVKFVTLVGLLFVMIGERLYVERLTMRHLSYYKENNTELLLIFGALGYFATNLWLENALSTI